MIEGSYHPMLEICPFLVKYSAKCLYRLLTEKSLYINVFRIYYKI
ncbi:hypothetical protein [Listeria monocytogenes]|nr:hypothetical protein [Listeria monocytogenes]EXL23153.1 hypothetical protein X842_1838 [Listeria monocytogenes Lm_1880]